MNFFKTNGKGILLCLLIAVPSWLLGKQFPIIGGPVIAIIAGMIITLFLKDKSALESGIKFTSKKILQYAVILLGFGLNLQVILQTGKQSLPIILCTITTSLVVAYILHKVMHIPGKISTLVGVGSSICGGSAVAATAPVIDADDEEVAQAISVIFFFNVLAAVLFPSLGAVLGFSQSSGEGFGIFAGTAVNDTSSVTAAASTWDSMYHLGSETLDKAVTVKLTRTLAIIPITLVLAFMRTRKTGGENAHETGISIFYPIFYWSFYNHYNCYCGRCVSRSIHAAERVIEILYRHGNGGNWNKYKYCEIDKNWRQTDFYGYVLLDWNYSSQPCHAACDGAVVEKFHHTKWRMPVTERSKHTPFY